MMKVLDIFSGIGGFSLGLERTGGFETVAFCEIEPFPRKVLKKHWPHVPCYEDVRTLTAERLAADGISVDVICGGFPCQDISSAGYKIGIAGERSGLWSEYARLISELRPQYVIVENVSALLSRGIDRVLADLAEIGFDAEWESIPASTIGAPHGRNRIWLVAYPNQDGEPSCAKHDEARRHETVRRSEYSQCWERPFGIHLAGIGRQRQPLSWDRVWPNEDSPLGMGVDDGLPERLDRLRALGNAVVPQIPELIGRAILASREAAA